MDSTQKKRPPGRPPEGDEKKFYKTISLEVSAKEMLARLSEASGHSQAKILAYLIKRAFFGKKLPKHID